MRRQVQMVSVFIFTFMLLLFTVYSSRINAEVSEKKVVVGVVHDFLSAWESNDVKTFSSLLHKDVLFAYPGDRLTKEQLIVMFKQYQTEKKEIKIYLWDHFVVEGDRFSTAYQFAATDRNTGKRQAVGTGVSGKIKDNKIILFKEYYDEEVATRQYTDKLPLDEGVVAPWPSSVWLRPETID